MRHYCTLFDVRYLPQGVALYRSLMRHSTEEFRLWILALDEETAFVLDKLHLQHAPILSCYEFNRDLAEIKKNRTHQEWCWTLASQLCERLLIEGLLEVTYLDADTYFYSDPAAAFQEIGMRSIAITPHRLIPSKKHLEVNGIFNVGFVHFKSTPKGRDCASEWAEDCRDWCFNRLENGKFGDQKYLDTWPSTYGPECCVIENVGVNAGPWSLANWKVSHSPFLSVPLLDGVPLICFHAHEFDAQAGRLTNYELRPEDRDLIYGPYLSAYHEAKLLIEDVGLAHRL